MPTVYYAGATPTLHELGLLKFTKDGKKEKLGIITKAAAKWRDIAQLLSSDPNYANVLEQQYRAPEDCLRQLFVDCFINNKPDNYSHDWNGIVELLDDVGLGVLSKQVEEAVQLR